MLDPLDALQSPVSGSLSSVTSGDVQSLRDEVSRLTKRVDNLVLINLALVELLRNRLGLTEVELTAGLDEVVRKREADSKATACESCGRPFDRRRGRCRYCGHERVTGVAERVLREL